MNTHRVSVIILNWNGWRDTIECLESVYRLKYSLYDVIVVDNGSTDESIQKIKEYAKGKIHVNSKFFKYNPENKPIKVFEITEDEAKLGKFNRPLYEKFDPDRRLILITNNDNYGFARGNNVGIKFALSVLKPDYILILNPDTIIPPDLLEALISGIQTTTELPKKNIGVAGPTVLYYNNPLTIDFAGAEIIPWKGKEIRKFYQKPYFSIKHNRSQQVSKIEGSCMLASSKMLFDVGLFDENFFCYWEETDLCIRAIKKGYILLHVPSARIWHKISTSTGGYLSDFYTYHYYRNKIWFLRKNYPKRTFVGYLLYLILWEFWYKNAQLLVKHKKPRTFVEYMRGLKDGIFGRCNFSD